MRIKESNTTLLLTSMYIAGIIGIAWPLHEDFVLLTPFNLVASLGLILWHHQEWNKALGIFLLLSFFVGFFMEMLGVQTGIIFGEYQYGEVLGWKIWGTPVLIGVNWALLVYASASVVNYWFPSRSLMVKTLLGAFLMTLLDVLIEPVAIQLNFWTWSLPEIPLQNYLAWFLIALPLQASFYTLLGQTANKVAIALFILQFLFFGILGLIL